jgi:hypothetical protein
MARSDTTHSHGVCPTCWSDISNKDLKDLSYFVSDCGPHENDDIMHFYQETSRLVGFLGALAQAGPRAAAAHAAELGDTPEWVTDYTWLAEELAGEVERRLLLLQEAGDIWKRRAKQSPARWDKTLPP